MIAEKMCAEKSRDYMNARRVAKEYEACTRGLDRAFLSLPPCGSMEELKQVLLSNISSVQFFRKISNCLNFFQIFRNIWTLYPSNSIRNGFLSNLVSI